MSVVNDVKKLVVSSRLFVESDKLPKATTTAAAAAAAAAADSSMISLATKEKNKKRGGRFARDVVKIGQGGTLDPLADGVLGMS